MSLKPARFDEWHAALEARHMRELTFQEVRRALQALSSLYVERRAVAGVDKALQTAGKRAAFALFYAPLHLLQVHDVIGQLAESAQPPSLLVDLGCGTGAAGIGWALAAGDGKTHPQIMGIDRVGWALQEARWNSSFFGLQLRAVQADATKASFATSARTGVLLAFTLNELPEQARSTLLERLVQNPGASHSLLVVEPIARRMSPWWDEWKTKVLARGGRADEWRFSPDLPERLRLLDKAAGLNHRELTCRSLWLP